MSGSLPLNYKTVILAMQGVWYKMENAPTSFLMGLSHVREVQIHQSLPSTNTYAKELLNSANDHGTVIWALEQTHGHGRLGRAWLSDSTSLTFSLIWRFPNYDKTALIPLAVGLGIVQALQIFSDELRVKWPNDVWAKGGKVAGILCESCRNEQGIWVIVGIGINVNQSAINASLGAVSLEELTGCPLPRLAVLIEALQGADHGLNRLLNGELDLSTDFERYGNFLHRRIILHSQGSLRPAIARRVLPDGRLVVEDEAGGLAVVMPDEVSLRFPE